MLVLLALVIYLVLKGGEGGGIVRHHLSELRERVDQMSAIHRELPVILEKVGVNQTRELSEQLVRLSSIINRQLESSEEAVARRLGETGKAVAEVHEKLGGLAAAARRMEELGASVGELRRLLEVPRLRGSLGELWLEELLRQVLPGAAFETQYAFASGETVDAVIRLGDRLVPVDSKFPLEACRRALQSQEAEREREWRSFRRSLQERVDEVAGKYIRPEEGTFNFALMYIPAEGIYYEAFIREEGGGRPAALEYALSRRVIPVSPNTFYAYLAVLVQGLQGLQVEQRAQEILDSLGGLRQSFDGVRRSLEVLGRHLSNASAQYNEAVRGAMEIDARLRRVAMLDEQEDRGPLVPGKTEDD